MSLLSSQAVQLMLLLLAALGVLFALSMTENPRDRMARRAREMAAGPDTDGPGKDDEDGSWHRQVLQKVSGLADLVPMFQGEQRDKIQTQLTIAGFRQRHHLSIFLAIKFTCGGLAVVGVALATESLLPLTPIVRLAAIFGGLFGGLVLPEAILDRMVKQRQRLLNRALPEALDLLVICTNAGYSLPASIQRVASELSEVCPAMAGELQMTAHEMQVMGDSVTVLRRLVDRTQIASMRSLVSTLVQAQQYGTPITQSLRTLAQSERTARMLAMEERAATLSVKITFPMMAFILPTVLIIAAGPAAIKLIAAFGK
jgi:tight adherence protein C